MGRHRNDNLVRMGKSLASSNVAHQIREGIRTGRISTVVIITGQNRRLDHLAFQYLGDSSMWWAIAAASGIGWGMQLPPSTRVVIPTSKEQIGDVLR